MGESKFIMAKFGNDNEYVRISYICVCMPWAHNTWPFFNHFVIIIKAISCNCFQFHYMTLKCKNKEHLYVVAYIMVWWCITKNGIKKNAFQFSLCAVFMSLNLRQFYLIPHDRIGLKYLRKKKCRKFNPAIKVRARKDKRPPVELNAKKTGLCQRSNIS